MAKTITHMVAGVSNSEPLQGFDLDLMHIRADGQSGSPPVLGTGHSEGSNPFGATWLDYANPK